MTRFTAHDLVREIEHELGGELTAYQQYQIQCEAKKLLEEKQTAYMHAFASGNLQDISKHRKEVFSLTRQIGQLVKYKLQTGAK